jgi:hypothetical protein
MGRSVNPGVVQEGEDRRAHVQSELVHNRTAQRQQREAQRCFQVWRTLGRN